METEIREAINNYTMESDFIDESNFFWTQAPQGLDVTYVVASINSNPTSRDSQKEYDEYFINFSIFGKVLSEIETFEAEIKTLYSGSLTAFQALLSTYTVAGWRRVSGASIKQDDVFFHNVVIIQIEVYLT